MAWNNTDERSHETMNKVIGIARHMFGEYEKLKQHFITFQESVDRKKEEEREQNRDKKVNEVNIHGYEMRIKELLEDLDEREIRLKECRQKIIDLK